MLKEIKLPIDDIRTRFKKDYTASLVQYGVHWVKEHHFITDLLSAIRFPELTIDTEKALVSEIQGHPGRVCITIPLKSDPKLASEILKGTGIGADGQKKHLTFEMEDQTEDAAVHKAREILLSLQNLSRGIAEDSEGIKAEILGLVKAELDAEEQKKRDSLQRNADLTALLRGK